MVALPGISNAIGLSAGSGSHACIVIALGVAGCWGSNDRGQLGNGTTATSNPPVRVSGTFPFVAVAAGDLHTCGLTVDGRVVCWGANDHGQLGNGGAADSHVPVAVSGISNATAVTAGDRFSCALIADGSATVSGRAAH